MFSVYFINCMLACLLAYLAGYYMASRAWTRKVTGLLHSLATGAAHVHKLDTSTKTGYNDDNEEKTNVH